ncbi:hypothetical protein N7452_007826 [Penicillium brevicompactum]|uniref:Uncharacterized protein n=1 Tax=Penicillium brevicompactum TaxID=5074 RepID=A0A9W9QG81_PENBR|nr:hypothetical protein N7452_007826 [Penicillium brevicompactum]
MVSSEPFQPPVVTNERIKEFRNTYPDFDRASETTIRNRIRWMAKKDWENRLINSNGPAEMGSQDPQPQVRRAGMFNGDEELEDIISSRCRTDEEYVRMLVIDLIPNIIQAERSVPNPVVQAVDSVPGPVLRAELLMSTPLTTIVRAELSVPGPVVQAVHSVPGPIVRPKPLISKQSVPSPVVQAKQPNLPSATTHTQLNLFLSDPPLGNYVSNHAC